MRKMLTRLNRLLLMIALGGVSSACSTVAPPNIVSDVSCIVYKPISFAQVPPGQKDDLGNVADSDATVNEIMVHNARFDAVCGARPKPTPTAPAKGVQR
jgi:hypothetical protein